VIVKNKKKFKWEKYYVDIIFLICIAKKDTSQTRRILADIYNIVDDSNILKEMRGNFSKKDILKNLGSE
jgi:mannitol/fructose-specific phosphotransferase system IIA component (Ntr-type)